MNYMLMVYDPADYVAQLTDEELAALEGRYVALYHELQKEGKLVGSMRLPENRPPETLRLNGEGDVTITDGPYAETKEILGGFFIVDCATMDEALELAARIPSAETGCVEVREVVDLDAMFAAE